MSDDTQNSTEYKPTRAEKSLLEVLLNPDCRFWTVTKKCEMAKISRKQYYNIFKKPEFAKYHHKIAKDFTVQFVLPTLHAFAKEAAAGSHPHGITILEMNKLVQGRRGGGLIDVEQGEGGSLTIIIGGKKMEEKQGGEVKDE